MAKLGLTEIMNLDSSKGSIKKIDLFLEDTIKNSYDYVKAVSMKAIIMHNLGEPTEALKLLFGFQLKWYVSFSLYSFYGNTISFKKKDSTFTARRTLITSYTFSD